MAITTDYSIGFVKDLHLKGLEFVSDAVGLESGTYALIGNQGGASTTISGDPSGEGQLTMPGYDGLDGAIAQLTDGNMVMVRDIGTNIAFDIRTSTGEPVTLGGDLGESGHDILNADVAALSNGAFVVAYQEAYGNGDNDIDISIRDAAGGEVMSFSIDTSTVVDQAPSITSLSNGGFVVTWQRTAGDGTELWYAVYNSNGGVAKSASLLDTAGSINGSPAVAALHNGGFAIAYEDNGWTPGDTDITLATFDQNGSSMGSTDISQSEENDGSPSLTVLSNGMIMVGSTTFLETGVDPRWTLVNPSTGAILATSDLGSREGFESGTAVAAMANGQFAAFYTDADEGAAVGQVLGVTRTQTGDTAGEVMFGDGLRDVIYGGGGADTIRGGAGADRLYGQGGDDTFAFNTSDLSAGEVINGGAGQDTLLISSSLDFTRVKLASLERIVFQADNFKFGAESILTVAAGQFGAGFASDLIIDGTFGGGGEIRVVMGKSNQLDLSKVQIASGDSATVDFVIFGDSSSETVIGSGKSDHIATRGGNDRLAGGGGIDLLRGGAGNDIYNVNAAGEALEGLNQGVDEVRSSVDYALGANIERLQLTGVADRAGTGNNLNNIIVGNSGDNKLYGKAGDDWLTGGAGKDELRGGLGNDVYFANAAGEAIEGAGQGTDTVRSSVGYVLGANLERLVLTGNQDVSARGNGLNNSLFGNGGDNVLNGSGGRDWLTGGAGKDAFLFNSALDAVGNVDGILDFELGADTIRLDDAIFAGLTNAGRAAAFHVGANAADASDRIIYNKTTGALFFDADGAGGAAKILFATLDPGLDLKATDFVVV